MTIIFYTFSKRRNSTATPTGGTSYTGTLRGASGVVNPSILMEFGNVAPTYNYAYIQEFSRYYWITEITTVGGGMWRVDMTCDVLASFKNDIGASSKYVLRSSAEKDGAITDLKYPTKVSYSTNVSSDSSEWSASGGRYVVGVISPGGTFGSVSVYCLTSGQFEQLRSALMTGTVYYDGIQDTDLKNLAITVSNPMQYIAFCRYYPFAIAPGPTSTMKLGTITVGGMNLIPGNNETFNYTLSLTNHPKHVQRGEYMSYEPFTQRFLSWLPIGMMHIPSSLLVGLSTIFCHVRVDLISGVSDFIVTSQNYTINQSAPVIYRTSFVCGTDIPVAQMVTGNPLKVITGAISLFSAGANAMAGNAAGAIGSGVSAIGNFLTANVPEVQAFKPGGGMLIADNAVRLIEYFYDVVDDDNNEFGRPLCKIKRIDELGGFIMCEDGDITSAATPAELSEIDNYLRGGFFYE